MLSPRSKFLRVVYPLFACAAVLLALRMLALRTEGEASHEGNSRVIILGFDGVEPSIVERMLEAGELPNLDRLRKKGTYQRLQSSNPPQSPTAWSSFTTCKNPGNHGIYDFLRRTPRTYMPGVGFGTAKHPELAPDGSMAKPAEFVNLRKGQTFWAAADAQGARCKVLVVPFAFPADDLSDGCMLCGLGVPDIRGTTSTFFSFSDAYTKQEHIAGGIRIPLSFKGDVAAVTLPGARQPDEKRYIDVPITVTADRKARQVTVGLPDQTVTLSENEWSKWIEWAFTVTPKLTVHAISRIHVLEAGEQVRLYMTCLQFHPKRPYIPFSDPEGYSGELADRYGLYKTIGWIFDTHALRQDALSEDMFLEDVRKTMAWRERLALDELDRGKFDLLIAAWTGTDRVAHLFWRHRDPKHPLYTEDGGRKYGRAVEDTYEKMDEIVGKVMARLGENDLLMVLSDHGFHSFRKGFNVNTWLIRNGYLAVQGQWDAATSYNDKDFLRGYDWGRSKAYNLGLGSVFLNLRGREGQGTVDPADAPALIAELREKLLAIADPETGDKIFSAIYTREDYHGVSVADAPDIQLGYAEGYQSTKAAAKGAAPREVFEPNTDKWSGEHAASDVAITPGIFFASRPFDGKAPALTDLGVTALEYLELTVPPDFEGKSLL